MLDDAAAFLRESLMSAPVVCTVYEIDSGNHSRKGYKETGQQYY
jgi:hypothetical protein